ncbi:hypothetical protein RJ639_034311 [Escallonia herrerae]|uniref:Vacuolar iron transporter n=1 Tax=Escallonia herrerae TaxID=1293975 RepID=A0AA89BJS2_9ASTE|nr:hypothetical protein RJ639_034311 [Escallonia herrerae]
MASSRTLEACGEHRLSVVDEKEQAMTRMQRAQWLRAAILGANDGLLSTTSLMLGVGAAKEDQWSMILSGLAGALAGACSMAVGEYVSVSTQRDIESAVISQRSSHTNLPVKDDSSDIKLQIIATAIPTTTEAKPTKADFAMSPTLTPRMPIYSCETPRQKFPPISSPVRSPIMKVIRSNARKDTLQATDEEESREEMLPNPYKAAAASATAFLCGSLVPLLSAICVKESRTRFVVIVVVTSIALALFGGIGARLGGSPLRISAARVLVGGWISMAITYGLLKPLDRDDHMGHDTD